MDLAMTKKKCFNEHVDEERPPRHESREKLVGVLVRGLGLAVMPFHLQNYDITTM